jgi:spore coat protein CotH
MNLTNAIGQASAGTFRTLVDQYVDVDAWLRGHVGPILFGATDNYMAPDGRGHQHNVLFYFPPGRKAVAFPWDCDYLDHSNPAATLIGGDVAKFIENGSWERLYYGHMLDVEPLFQHSNHGLLGHTLLQIWHG